MNIIFIEDIDRDVKNWQASLETSGGYVGNFKEKHLPKDISPEEATDAAFLKGYLNARFYEPRKVPEFIHWLDENVHPDTIKGDLENLMGTRFIADSTPRLNNKQFISCYNSPHAPIHRFIHP